LLGLLAGRSISKKSGESEISSRENKYLNYMYRGGTSQRSSNKEEKKKRTNKNGERKEVKKTHENETTQEKEGRSGDGEGGSASAKERDGEYVRAQ